MLVYIVQRRGDDRKVSHRQTTADSQLLVQVAGLQHSKPGESAAAGFEAAAMAVVIDTMIAQGQCD